MRRSSLLSILLSFLSIATCFGQEGGLTLSKDELLGIVRTYHPLVVAADIRLSRAKADVLAARGSFDPKVKADYDRKTFDNKVYYNYFNPEISIPTWYGVDIKAGAEDVLGERVNNETTLGQTTYAGVNLNANSLIFDKRRASLRQAQAISNATAAEKEATINNVLLEAAEAYWDWVKAYQYYKLVTEVTNNTQLRYRFVVTEYIQGSRPAIDTTEILAQLQTFYVQQNEAELALTNAGLLLSTFMWNDAGAAVDWDDRIKPDSGAIAREKATELPSFIHFSNSIADHPKLRSIGYKIEALEIDRKLKAQYLIPKVDLSANVLGKGYNLPSSDGSTFLENNHKLGLSFSLPILQREARGMYKSAGLKIDEANTERSYIARQIENKVRSYYNEVLAVRKQAEIFNNAYLNNRRMFEGEKTRFTIGESSVFMVNTREVKLLQSALKLVDLNTKLQKKTATLFWSAGLLDD